MTDAPDPLGPLGRSGQPILDRLAFERLTMAHKRELKLHCYRMMGSLNEAEDLVQDTLLRAWRARLQFDGRGSARGWLYAIATNNCLNAIKARAASRRMLELPGRAPSDGSASGGPAAEIAWLEPYPDSELPNLAAIEPGPEARYEAREAVQLAFVAAIQLLPPRQRAALLLCDVLGWSAVETAQLLGGSTASINSALQRARAKLGERYPEGRPSQPSRPSQQEGLLLERYMQAWQADNLDGLVDLLREDAAYHMPPWREWYYGREAIRGFLATVWGNFAGYRTVATRANGQPAAGVYARSHQDQAWRPHSLHVIEPDGGAIASLTIYVPPLGPDLFAAFGLPPA
ncbi:MULTISPECIES: RNA polymerase subunit sigma-70 [unclassified Mesorhizobium]|uniref:RNA polymerase subunit sigma-70 n=1 Tax=unclassified Mesorhizobium TaxID=325217 RepID=UPI000FCA7FD7|nr:MULTISPECIES: RNA polymerase subunit sigma-70 [unclassified Mesorhizobium]TGP23967.1 sigma-70 family RNA polymerase sigma factor [Mesorhizobium sp. M1D.F.Ca.ET.231.01.1.1]TGP35446.1 sigma-70 family RNA polymerase sigma factor [Mesorhizobium sp. M1D.F.Ca.ET.234.01.1.1]TGS49469.1 sigma-70 family RNA polymerase sigma factor [Mesorhizobium sp. M1D.F.Ca.ET.184.01.1.1]TGS63665.1 sigma-70 family RNA polymerase sigma factor [Mesorhizobium sp. M1D.F.Ca.ET.183.01.1.1]